MCYNEIKTVRGGDAIEQSSKEQAVTKGEERGKTRRIKGKHSTSESFKLKGHKGYQGILGKALRE